MDPMTLSALISGGTSLLGGLFGNRGNKNQASEFLNQIPQIGRDTYNPYIQQGQQAQNLLTTQNNRMAANPMDFINQISSGYKPSQGYQFREKRALDAARNSAAQGGFSGTQEDQLSQAGLLDGLLGQDMQQWLQNVLGVQGAGMQGQQNTANMGFNASTNLADLLGSTASAQAGLANQNYRQNRNDNYQMIGGLAQMLGAGGEMAAGSDWFKNLFGGSAGDPGNARNVGSRGGIPNMNRGPDFNRMRNQVANPFVAPSNMGGFRYGGS